MTHVDPLAVTGSLRHGGRYNIPGEFAALYASIDEETARAEVTRGVSRRGIDPGSYAPKSWAGYEIEVHLAAVLDLTDVGVLERLGVDVGALTDDNLGVPRSLGAEARAAGYDGLIVPSAAVSGGRNLVIFLDRCAHRPVVIGSRLLDRLS